ncbi:MAG TPA: adenylate/guanylate cyclase domain-containing protein [Phototrophicaceae bacterium]|nr:adenylate/guanylate cyclase domain-containing protein [Phototrophicaceae bacterium]
MAGETILVIDDGRENREFVIEYILQPNGYQSLQAEDGRDGVQMAMQHHPDLILLDLQMPRMNGIEVLKFLTEHQMDIPVVLMTFHGSEDIAIEVYRLGVRDYVKKPYTVEEMLTAIEHSLGEVRLRREKEQLTEKVVQANRELQRRVSELNVLHSVGKNVNELLSMNELLPRIVDAAAQITQAEEGYIYLIENNNLLCRAHKRGGSNSQARPADFMVTDRVASYVIKQCQPVVLKPEHLAREGSKAISAAYAPITIRGEVAGVLGVNNVSPDAHVFTKHDSALLSMLTDYVAISIENAYNYEALRQAKERESQQMRVSFERLVPPSVVDRVLANPEDLRLGGTRQEISIIFADIRGYTAWSENAPPEKVVEMLNDYLSLAAEIILAWDGTLDKFFGDGLMAIFNAPKGQEDHVHRAADAALALMRAGEEMRARRGDNLSYSIGVHVGEAVVGYIGTERAMNYTAIGDVVNTAKRLQELAPPGHIWIEDSIVQRLGDLVEAQPLGEIKIRGRKQPAHAYDLTGLKPKP